jgi:hypothetical protein
MYIFRKHYQSILVCKLPAELEKLLGCSILSTQKMVRLAQVHDNQLA